MPEKSTGNRLIATPAPYTRSHYLYVQEIGSLISVEPHLSSREDLNSFLFLLVLSGRGKLTYNGTVYRLRQGDCAWLDCRLPYSHKSSQTSPWELKWVHFYGRDAPSFYQAYTEQDYPACFSPYNTGALNEALSAMYAVHRQDTPLKELLSHKYLTDIITLCFLEHTDSHTQKKDSSSKVPAVREYLKEHFAEDITLDGLSSLFYISKYHLSREYRRHFGATLNNDLTSMRISHAKSLLRSSGMPIGEIAAACGYRDANYFAKAFKKAEKMTPLEYRRKW